MDFQLTNPLAEQTTILSLPTEIRLQIFRELANRLLVVTVRFDGIVQTWPPKGNSCGLLTVCKQINDQYLYTLYGNTQFRFHSVQVMADFITKIGTTNSRRISSAIVGVMSGIEPLLSHPEAISIAMPNLRFLQVQGIGKGRPRKAKTPASARLFVPEEWDKKHLRVIKTLSTMPGLAGGRIHCTGRHSRMTLFWGRRIPETETTHARFTVGIDLAQAERECAAQAKEEGRKRYQARKKRLVAKKDAESQGQ